MRTYKLFATVTGKEGNPFEGQEIRIYVESKDGESYSSLFFKYGFTAIFCENEDQAKKHI
jgi:hypothetical protein